MISIVNCRKLLAVLILIAPVSSSYGFGGVNNHWVVNDCEEVYQAVKSRRDQCRSEAQELAAEAYQFQVNSAADVNEYNRRHDEARSAQRRCDDLGDEVITWCYENIRTCNENKQAAIEAHGPRLVDGLISFRLYPSGAWEANCTELE